VVERGPEKAGVGGSIPSLATTSRFQHIPSRLIPSIGPYFSALDISGYSAVFVNSARSVEQQDRNSHEPEVTENLDGEVGGDTKLVNPSSFATKTFKMVGILSLFGVFATEQEAIDVCTAA
jgi:hypothetical protein